MKINKKSIIINTTIKINEIIDDTMEDFLDFLETNLNCYDGINDIDSWSLNDIDNVYNYLIDNNLL